MGNYKGLDAMREAITREVGEAFKFGVTANEFKALLECLENAPFHMYVDVDSFALEVSEGEVLTANVKASGTYFSGREIFKVDGLGNVSVGGGWTDGRNTAAILYALNEWLMNE